MDVKVRFEVGFCQQTERNDAFDQDRPGLAEPMPDDSADGVDVVPESSSLEKEVVGFQERDVEVPGKESTESCLASADGPVDAHDLARQIVQDRLESAGSLVEEWRTEWHGSSGFCMG